MTDSQIILEAKDWQDAAMRYRRLWREARFGWFITTIALGFLCIYFALDTKGSYDRAVEMEMTIKRQKNRIDYVEMLLRHKGWVWNANEDRK